jgi:NAD(P)-dependent dehydrogenase (short-subunit alcohol dehydrogenase family)
MRDLSGKRAVVTGAAAGIGRAIALDLARAGCRLFLIDVNEEGLAAVLTECGNIGADAYAHVCNLADPHEISRAADCAVKKLGAVEILVNNAGVAYYGPTHEMSADQWERLLAINLLAPIRLIHALLPTLRAQPRAHILNVASVTGLVPKRRIAAYQTSKFGLVGLSQSLRAEYSPYGLGVTALCCGFVRTDLLTTAQQQGMGNAAPRIRSWWSITPEKVARRALRAIRSNQGIVVFPLLAGLFWRVQRFSPLILDWHGHLTHWNAIRRRARKVARAASVKPAVTPVG